MQPPQSQWCVLFLWLNELQSTYSGQAQAQHMAQAPRFQPLQLTECSLWKARVADVTLALACCWHNALIYVTTSVVQWVFQQDRMQKEREGEGRPVSRKKAACKINDDILTKHKCVCVCVYVQYVSEVQGCEADSISPCQKPMSLQCQTFRWRLTGADVYLFSHCGALFSIRHLKVSLKSLSLLFFF